MSNFNLKTTTKKGDLFYRLPNVIEGYDYLATADLAKGDDVFLVKSRIARVVGPLVDFASLGYESWEQLINDRENIPSEATSEIVNTIFDDIMVLLRKKG